jgi:hypothetical protein
VEQAAACQPSQKDQIPQVTVWPQAWVFFYLQGSLFSRKTARLILDLRSSVNFSGFVHDPSILSVPIQLFGI